VARIIRGVCTLGLALATGLVGAAEPGHPCATIAEPGRRLACYDAAFGQPAEIQVEARERAEQEFGLSDAERRARDPVEATRVEPDRIEASVTKVRYGDSGERVVSLDNGQVWVTTERGSRGTIDVGERVAVRKAALGTHMLVTAARVPLRVRRVR
jgi:hypothetical protein